MVETTIVVHFYRAIIMRADVWRKRMDVTTNWAVVSSATLVTFGFSNAQNTHMALLIAIPLLTIFALLEARRYQMYHLWQHHVRTLNRLFVAPALKELSPGEMAEIEQELSDFADTLGDERPRIALRHALGFRIRRNYGLLLGAVTTLWFIKLASHPEPSRSFIELIHHARLGPFPGWLTCTGVAFFNLGAILLALTSPDEHITAWRESLSPATRLRERLKKTQKG